MVFDWKRASLALAAVTGGMALATSAQAVVVQWADLTGASSDAAGVWTINGNITVGDEVVGVTFTGTGVRFVQTSGGYNYYESGNAYTNGDVENRPGTADIIAIDYGGLKEISFTKAVSNVYLALVSWNQNSGTFNQPITPVSAGCGFFGCGNFTNVTDYSFTSQGELHGILKFAGNFNSVSFIDNAESWHGITVGIGGVAPIVPGAGAVPEPATWALLIVGFGGAGAMLRRRAAAWLQQRTY